MTAHPVKIERHDTVRYQHHTNTGVRRVCTYREHAGGLYVSRDFVGHPRVRHWQAHLLPELGVQLCRYDFYGDREHDYYLDIATITREGAVWSVRDHYLDLTVQDGHSARVLDTDELLEARAGGLISEQEAAEAILSAHVTLNGLAAHGYHVQRWLAGHGLQLEWQVQSGAQAALA